MTTLTKAFDVAIPESLINNPSVIGIMRIPFSGAYYTTVNVPYIRQTDGKFESMKQALTFMVQVDSNQKESSTFTIPKSKVTDFYPYTYYVLTDGECDPLILKTQYMKTSSKIIGKYAISHQSVERYYIEGYKGDDNGNVYNITNTNQMNLPYATNEGISYLNANANTIAQTKKNTNSESFLSIAKVGAAAATGGMMGGAPGAVIGGLVGAASTIISGINNVQTVDARNQDTLLTPNSIANFGTPSTRDKFDNNKVRLLKYSVSDNVKNKIENFTKRYGNKYNNYATIDLKSYKGYLKMIDPDVDTKIDNMYISKIIEILERGIYIE